MVYKIFCIKDTMVGFMQPFLQVNEAVAVREFTNIVNSEGSSIVSQNFKDMELYCLGSFNQDTGTIENDVSFVIKGADVRKVVVDE